MEKNKLRNFGLMNVYDLFKLGIQIKTANEKNNKYYYRKSKEIIIIVSGGVTIEITKKNKETDEVYLKEGDVFLIDPKISRKIKSHTLGTKFITIQIPKIDGDKCVIG